MRARDLRAGEGGRALLFDRLTDLEPEKPEEETPLRTLDSTQVKASIRREVERILNTRSTAPPEDLETREWTVLDYGLPDFSGWYTRSHTAKGRLEVLVRKAIEAYEPRLLSPAVSILPQMEGEHTLFLQIEGAVRIGQIVEPVSFPLALQSNSQD